jgi:hypothetical protein
MSKPFSVEELSNQMERDLTWRLREISDLKVAITRADPISRPVLLRAFVAVAYAHWEGHVRLCAVKYFQYIALRKMPYSKLENQIYLNYFLPRLDAFFRSKASIEDKCQLVEDILQSRNKRFSQVNISLIDAKANLSSHVLRDLCRVCGVPFATFEDKTTFIDIIMLKRRNEVAHGEAVFLNDSEVNGIADQVIDIMRLFRNLLENKVYTGSYLS